MSDSVASKIIRFIFEHTPQSEKIEIGFFGGEPLLAFGLVITITAMIESHPSFEKDRVELTIVTNGTIYSERIMNFIKRHNIVLGISCDGDPYVQNMFRRFSLDHGSSEIVEGTIRKAIKYFPNLMVNAVYRPETLEYLHIAIEYFSSLGLRQIYLNPDFLAKWNQKNSDLLFEAYDKIADKYIHYYLSSNPHFISLIDSKISTIIRGGYGPRERCRMGNGELAFSPDGNIFPCERLIGSGTYNEHCIGSITDGLKLEKMSCHSVPSLDINTECVSCGLKNYCMNWCGCSNFFSTGYYNRVSPFLCSSEKAAITAAFRAFKTLEKKLGTTFFEHLAGLAPINSIKQHQKTDEIKTRSPPVC